MQARIKNPGGVLPGAMQAIQGLMAAIQSAGVPAAVLELVHLRSSQINGCSACVDGGVKHAKAGGDGRAPVRGLGVARGAVFLGCRARRSGTGRSDDPAGGPTRSGSR